MGAEINQKADEVRRVLREEDEEREHFDEGDEDPRSNVRSSNKSVKKKQYRQGGKARSKKKSISKKKHKFRKNISNSIINNNNGNNIGSKRKKKGLKKKDKDGHEQNATGMSRFTDLGILTLAQSLKNLRVLNIRCAAIEGFSFSCLAHGCPELEVLQIDNAPFLKSIDMDLPMYEASDGDGDSGEREVARCPGEFENLTRLSVSFCNMLGDSDVLELVGACPRLRYLSIAECDMITGKCFEMISRTACAISTLESVSIDSCPSFSDFKSSAMRPMPCVRHVSIANCMTFCDAAAYILLGTCVCAERVDIRNCESLGQNALQMMEHTSPRDRALALLILYGKKFDPIGRRDLVQALRIAGKKLGQLSDTKGEENDEEEDEDDIDELLLVQLGLMLLGIEASASVEAV